MKKNTEQRIREIIAEIASITEFAEGSIKRTASTYRVKDGSRRKSNPQHKFQSRGARGHQVCRHIPEAQVARVKRLVENGRRYRKLEAEYFRLVTEASLEGSLKKRP